MRNIMFLGMALCFAFSSTALAESLRQVIVFEIKGPVEVRMDGGEWQRAEAGMVLHQTDEVRTGKGGYAVLLVDEEAATGKLELKEKSFLTLETLQYGLAPEEKVTVLDLAIGRMLVHAEKLRKDSRFEVKTPTATTGVKGTVFEVSVDEE